MFDYCPPPLFPIGIKMDWAPYSPDLIPCDYFLRGFLKDKFYTNSPTTLNELENEIRSNLRLIDDNVLAKVMKNIAKRLQYVVVVQDTHLENIIN